MWQVKEMRWSLGVHAIVTVVEVSSGEPDKGKSVFDGMMRWVGEVGEVRCWRQQ